MSDSTRFIVDQILPTNALHVIYGPSGAGRSILLYQTMDEWRQGRPVFGHESHPLPFIAMSTLHSQRHLEMQLASLGCDILKIPHLSLQQGHKREEHTIEGVIRRAKALIPDVRVLFIDGMTSLCPGNIMIYREASIFLLSVADQCQMHNITIIGTTSCGKADDENVRHKPIGSVAWNDHSSTRFVIDFAKPGKLDDPGRLIHVLPRFAPPQSSLRYMLDPQTHLLIRDESIELGIQKELDEWLARQQPGAELSTIDIQIAGTQMGLGRSTIYNWIRDCVELGLLQKVKHGIYTRPQPPSPEQIQ